MAKDYIVPIELQNIDAAAIGAGAFSGIGNPLEGACSFIRITNDSNTDVIISYDGINDHEYIPATKTMSTYFQINSVPASKKSLLRKGTIVYIRGTAGIGYIFLSGYYNE